MKNAVIKITNSEEEKIKSALETAENIIRKLENRPEEITPAQGDGDAQRAAVRTRLGFQGRTCRGGGAGMGGAAPRPPGSRFPEPPPEEDSQGQGSPGPDSWNNSNCTPDLGALS